MPDSDDNERRGPSPEVMEQLGFEALMGMRAQSMGRDPNEVVSGMRSISPQLLKAYRETDYIIRQGEHDITLKIEQELPVALSALLEQEGEQSWSIISAYNPFSEPVSDEANQRKDVLLRQVLAEMGKTVYPAVGRGQSGEWEEPSHFVMGLSYEMAQALGTVFEQNAVLYGELGASLELVFCGR